MTFTQAFNESQNIFINTTFTNAHAGALPINAWAVLTCIGAIIAIVAFWMPLRNTNGEVNPARILLSILGMIWCGFVAYSSLVIDSIDGVGVTSQLVNNTTTVISISQHSLIEMPTVALLFGVVSALLLMSLIYSLTLKDIVTADTTDYKAGAGRKEKERRED